MTEREKIVRRIAALIALASSNDNQSEAQSALAKAQELMQRYEVSENDIPDERSGAINADTIEFKTKRVPKWKSNLIVGITDLFGCSALRRNGYGQEKASYVIAGVDISRQFAVHLILSLTTQVEQLSRKRNKKWRRSKRKRTRLAAYREGLSIGIIQRVKDLLSPFDSAEHSQFDSAQHSQFGLIRLNHIELSERASEWLHERYDIVMVKNKQRRHRDVLTGLKDSRNVTVARAIETTRIETTPKLS